MRRAVVTCLAFWLVSALFMGIGAIAANPSDDFESGFVARIGDERAAGDLPALVVAQDLVDVARRHAADMQRQQRLHHNPRLGDDVQGWQEVGENVGVGPSVEEIHQKLMASTTHRNNIVHGQYTEVGVGVVADGADLWVVQVFRLPDSGAQPAAAGSPGSVGGSSAGASATPAPPTAPGPRPTPARPSRGDSGIVGETATGGVRPAATTSAAATTTEEAAAPAPVEGSTSGANAVSTDVGRSRSVRGTATGPRGYSADFDLSDSDRHVTWPIALAASLLLGVVAALAVHVGGRPVRSAAETGRRASLLDMWKAAFAG